MSRVSLLLLLAAASLVEAKFDPETGSPSFSFYKDAVFPEWLIYVLPLLVLMLQGLLIGIFFGSSPCFLPVQRSFRSDIRHRQAEEARPERERPGRLRSHQSQRGEKGKRFGRWKKTWKTAMTRVTAMRQTRRRPTSRLGLPVFFDFPTRINKLHQGHL